MENVILILILVGIISASAIYIIREKRKGRKCIGCPYGDSCSKNNCSCCNNSK